MNFKKAICVKFFVDNQEFAQRTLYHTPRAGDEARFRYIGYYKIKRVVWVYDEEEHIHSRANIELEKIQD